MVPNETEGLFLFFHARLLLNMWLALFTIKLQLKQNPSMGNVQGRRGHRVSQDVFQVGTLLYFQELCPLKYALVPLPVPLEQWLHRCVIGSNHCPMAHSHSHGWAGHEAGIE